MDFEFDVTRRTGRVDFQFELAGLGITIARAFVGFCGWRIDGYAVWQFKFILHRRCEIVPMDVVNWIGEKAQIQIAFSGFED